MHEWDVIHLADELVPGEEDDCERGTVVSEKGPDGVVEERAGAYQAAGVSNHHDEEGD